MRKNKNGQLCFFPCAIPNRSNFVLFCMASRSEKFVFFGGTEGETDRKKKGGGEGRDGRDYRVVWLSNNAYAYVYVYVCCVRVCALSHVVFFVVVHYLLVCLVERNGLERYPPPVLVLSHFTYDAVRERGPCSLVIRFILSHFFLSMNLFGE